MLNSFDAAMFIGTAHALSCSMVANSTSLYSRVRVDRCSTSVRVFNFTAIVVWLKNYRNEVSMSSIFTNEQRGISCINVSSIYPHIVNKSYVKHVYILQNE